MISEKVKQLIDLIYIFMEFKNWIRNCRINEVINNLINKNVNINNLVKDLNNNKSIDSLYDYIDYNNQICKENVGILHKMLNTSSILSQLELKLDRMKCEVTNTTTNNNNPSDVLNTSNPMEKARRKAVNDLTSSLMKKNPKLEPGNTDKNTVATLTSNDPKLSQADAATQQAVTSFFLK